MRVSRKSKSRLLRVFGQCKHPGTPGCRTSKRQGDIHVNWLNTRMRSPCRTMVRAGHDGEWVRTKARMASLVQTPAFAYVHSASWWAASRPGTASLQSQTAPPLAACASVSTARGNRGKDAQMGLCFIAASAIVGGDKIHDHKPVVSDRSTHSLKPCTCSTADAAQSLTSPPCPRRRGSRRCRRTLAPVVAREREGTCACQRANSKKSYTRES